VTEEKIEIRDHRQPGWFWLDNEMIDIHGREIGVYGLAVYCCLARHADNRSQRAWPGIRGMAERLGTGKDQVYKALWALEVQKLVSIERRPGQGSIYTLRAVGRGVPSAGTPAKPRCTRSEDICTRRRDSGVPAAGTEQDSENKTKEQHQSPVVAFSNSLLVALGELGVSDVGVAFLNRTWSETECRKALSWVMTKKDVSNPAGYLLSMAKRGQQPTDFVPASATEKASDAARKAEQLKARTCWERDRQPCRSVEERKPVYTWCEYCDLFAGKARTDEA
jgi:hypothetical protein